MKKIFFIILFSLIFSNFSFSKTIDVGLHELEVPNKFNLINFFDYEVMNESCEYFDTCYGLVDNKIMDIIDEMNSGRNYEDIKILKPLISKYEKMMNSEKNFERNFKSFFKIFKSTLSKNNSGIMFSYYGSKDENSTSKILNKFNIDINIDEIKGMSNSELKMFTKEIKNKITSGSNSFQIMDGLFINFKKFSILRNTNNTVYLVFNGEIKYILGSSTTKLGNMAYYFSEIENKIFVLDGICMVKCSKFFSNFDQIVQKSFNQKSSINNASISADKNIVEQLEQLNSLFKSGVLTQEEFEKAKKKILN